MTYPLVLKHGQLSIWKGFSYIEIYWTSKKWWFSLSMSVYQRVYTVGSQKAASQTTAATNRLPGHCKARASAASITLWISVRRFTWGLTWSEGNCWHRTWRICIVIPSSPVESSRFLFRNRSKQPCQSCESTWTVDTNTGQPSKLSKRTSFGYLVMLFTSSKITQAPHSSSYLGWQWIVFSRSL